MGETSLQTIIKLIDEHDEVKLREALEEDNSEINQYHDMPVDSKLSVRVSPLHFAVKVKAPRCVEVLLEFGADIKMKLKTPENKSLPITALQLAEGERDVAIKNKRDTDIAIYDDIVHLIKEHDKKKKKKKKAAIEKTESGTEQIPHVSDQNGAGRDAPSTPIPTSISLNTLEKGGPVGNGGDLVTTSSVGNIGTIGLHVPPSPSSALDFHKVTLRATQNQLAIKKLEEKNELLQKEIEGLRQDMELLKKLVVSLDLQRHDGDVEEHNKRKTVVVSKISSEKSITKTKERKKTMSTAQPPREEEEDVSGSETKRKLSSSNAGSGQKEKDKRDRAKSPRDEKFKKEDKKDSVGSTSGKKKKTKS